jgi:RNA-directed DNA polymerase
MTIMQEPAVRQALANAWVSVRSKAAAPGLDGIDAADFQKDAARQLGFLARELLDGSYQPLPARMFTLKKGAKARELGILYIRDRVAQLALANLLRPVFEPQFSACCYAFLPGRSARAAVTRVCELLEMERPWFVRTDIDAYFDCIPHDLLLAQLEPCMEADALRLVRQSISMPELRDGVETKRAQGLCQGSPLSPLLSNVFLLDFDREAEQYGCDYLRYCDDLLFLSEREDMLPFILEGAQASLGRLRLRLKESKTSYGRIADGFSYLGYRFSDAGSIAQTKAIQSLTQRLEACLDVLLEQLAGNVRAGADVGTILLYRGEQRAAGAVAAILRAWRFRLRAGDVRPKQPHDGGSRGR